MNGVRPIYIFLPFVGAGMACSLPGLSDNSTEAPKPELTEPPSVQSANQCGDGICAGPENIDRCPEDCDAPVTASTQPPSEGMIPPLYFFDVIHTHGEGDWKPYEGPPMVNLDTEVADNMLALINGIRTSLDRYGAQGSWEVVYGTTKGLCAHQGENHVFRQLLDSGHEIAIHAHRTEHIETAYQSFKDNCGIAANTASGFILDADRAGLTGAQDALVSAIKISIILGMTVGTENLSPGGEKNTFAELCDNQIGDGNDMWASTGNLMFPWRPNYTERNICEHDPEGSMVFVDHVNPDWMFTSNQGGPADILNDTTFNQLKTQFDAALNNMKGTRPDQVATWGFVTHLTEYAKGGEARFPPDPGALAALDQFLVYLDLKQSEGRVIYATATEIASRIFLRR